MIIKNASLVLSMLILSTWVVGQEEETKNSGFFPVKHPVKVFYDNDEATDVYTDEYLYALQQTGEIEMLGVSTSSSVGPLNKYVLEKDYWRMHSERLEGIIAAKNAGFENLPAAFKGPMGHIIEPSGSKIEDAKPLFSEAAGELIRLANELSDGESIFILAGGPLTMVADAYLQDPSIVEKIYIGWVGGNIDDVPDYNAWADPWATYICMKNFKMMLVPFILEQCPDVTRELIDRKLPESELSSWMYDKNHHVLSDSQKGHDVDVPPMIALLYPDYIVKSYRAAVSGWKETGYDNIMYNVPATEKDPGGNLLIIEERNGALGTDFYWRDMKKAFALIK